ncbi:hypothetical protein OH708_23465 [Pseudomonas capsici]|uniref:hypothetical protein n=1 Tax=Pseudomonas capsici TaxID=2810614 RepID=UPI0021F22935|nr:hypothetical protein [Pseudomonas capsici]MCV4290876.1 hypothetical protein [Pseudomonas capsici]
MFSSLGMAQLHVDDLSETWQTIAKDQNPDAAWIWAVLHEGGIIGVFHGSVEAAKFLTKAEKNATSGRRPVKQSGLKAKLDRRMKEIAAKKQSDSAESKSQLL